MADTFKTIKVTQSVPGGPLQEQLVGAVSSSSSPGPGSPDAGKVLVLDSTGQIDSSFISGGGSTAFSAITGSTNTTAAMIVGTGASLTFSGSGVINANEIIGLSITGGSPTHAGQLLISQPGNTSVAFADPLVQGLYAAGSNITTPPVFAAPTTIQPVLIGGSDYSGPALQNWKVDSSGLGYVSVSNAVTISGTVAATQSGTWNIGTVTTITNPVTVSGTVAVSSVGGTVTVTGTVAATQSGTWDIGTITNPVAVTGTFFQATQPVSGTVTANQGTSPWVVSVTSTTITGTVAVTQSTSPWVVSGTVTTTPPTHASTNVDQIGGAAIALGQTTMSASVPVVIASDQTSVPVTAAQSTAANLNATVVGTGTFAVQAAQSGTWNIGTVATITNPVAVTGTFFQATQPVSIAANVPVTQVTSPWVVSLTSTTVTGTVAVTQSTSPWVTSENHFTHTLNQDGSGNVGVTVQNSSSTATATAQTAVSSSSGSVLATNANRKECMVVNTGITVVYIALGQTPTTSAYHVALSACTSAANDGTGGTYVSDLWKGAINAICAVSGTVCVTELT